MDRDRVSALNSAVSQIERQFGKGAIMRLGAEPVGVLGSGVISSGSLSVDLALGVGGFPRGRVVEVYGPESGGKTTLALHVVAEAQRAGGVAAFVDAEHALDPVYAAALGVNVDELLVSQPDTGEQALEIVELMAQIGVVDADPAGGQARDVVVDGRGVERDQQLGRPAGDVALVADPDVVPGGQPLDVRREDVLAVNGDAELEEGAQQGEVGRLTAGAVGGGHCDREVVDDGAGSRHRAWPTQRFLNTHRSQAPPRWGPKIVTRTRLANPDRTAGRGRHDLAHRPRRVWRHSTALAAHH